jgi:heme exporter protein C
VNVWRTLHPKTTVVPTLQPGMRGPFWVCVTAFLLLYVLAITARAHLEAERARLEEIYLSIEE